MDDSANILEETLDARRVFDGILLNIDHLTNRLPDGRTIQREVARHIGASAILPVDDDGNVWLVRQFRAPVGRALLEIPAGKLNDRGEDRLEAAKRELEEETGLTAGSWVHLMDLLTTPGFSDEVIGLYLARDLRPGRSHPDDDEFLNVVKVPFADLAAAVRRGEIPDGKTAVATLLAEGMLRSSRPDNQ